MVTGSKECRVYLLDTKNAGGDDHQTPLDRTPLLCNEEVTSPPPASGAPWPAGRLEGTRWV